MFLSVRLLLLNFIYLFVFLFELFSLYLIFWFDFIGYFFS